MSEKPTPDEEPRPVPVLPAGAGPAAPGDLGGPVGEGRPGDVGVPDGEGLPGGPGNGRRAALLAAWRRTYGASPAHLLLHLAAIALIAWALAQSFDARYSASYLNLAIWMVAGAVINDLVAIPLYVGADRLARGLWGLLRGTHVRSPAKIPPPVDPHPPQHADHFDASWGAGAAHDPAPTSSRPAAGTTTPATDGATVAPATTSDRTPSRAGTVLGNGHVRVPLAMSAVLLLVYFPNIAHKAPAGHRLSTGLAEQPDYAARWLAITAGLFIASAIIYGIRSAAARTAAPRHPAR